MSAKVWIALVVEFLFFAGLLFGAAGTLHWPAAWAYLVAFFVIVLRMTLMLARHDPALLNERMKPFVQKDQPLWDKILMSVIAFVFVGWLILMGLDAGRFGWSVMPVWVQVIGAAGVGCGMWICYLALQTNTFLATVVRIQSERQHRVVSTGPYGVVRHPLYAGVLIFLPCTALMLGSWYGVGASVLLIDGVILRTILEDRELRRRLDGYTEYARRVRYRLVPFVW